ncbi:TIM barrel protein [Streptomyces regalis]|uniref:Xylose isomerase-like TIM barrel domain-containing protein n=1 Tax=Streptomyces regalis TaxID=68262 RepID=A0A0X3VDG4_9ACTN|nr:TIM barrel protein [Streptomyces regalis]KUL42770.1 hypothetical protein ADL12_08970 [Streptomyces regalis]
MVDQVKLNVKIGITPTCWRNADFEEIGKSIKPQQIVKEIKEAGYLGCSLAPYFPGNKAKLDELLGQNLVITEPWVGTLFTQDGGLKKTIDEFRKNLEFWKQMGVRRIGAAEMGGAVHLREIGINKRPKFSAGQWDSLITGLNTLGAEATERGIQLCYHPHMGTGVQTQQEMDRVMCATNAKDVHLLLDTGHLTWAGGDPVEAVRRHGQRIKHVHLKNVRKTVLENKALDPAKTSFQTYIKEGIFTVPGDGEGVVPFDAFLKELEAIKYNGDWLVVEAEQDPDRLNKFNKTPKWYADKARKFLSTRLEKAEV